MLDGMRKRISQIIAPNEKAQGGTPVTHILSTQMSGIPIYPEMTVRRATRDGYKVSVYVYRAVRTIIQACSGIPWIVQNRKDGEPIEGHPLEKLLQNPNPEFSGQDIIELLIGHLELAGNALWQPVLVNNQPKEIWPVMPDLVQPVPSDRPGEWLKEWRVTTKHGKQESRPPNAFIHFMQTDPGNPYWGIGPLMAAARVVDTDNEAQDTQKVSMQNRGVTDGVFTHEAPLSQEQFEEARRQIREKFLNKANRREPWVLGAGAKWHQMSLTPVEMDYIASRLANMRAIASAFGLDPWWLGDKQASTFSNVAEARKALYQDVIVPLLDDIRSTLNLRVAPMYPGNIYINYNLAGVPALREDYGKKVDQAHKLWSMGVPFNQINDRLDMGFEDFAGWDSGYLPMNLIPAGSSSQKPAQEEEGGEDEEEAGQKALDMHSEEVKTAYWKMIDNRRMGWWGVVAKRAETIYAAEIAEITKAIKGKDTPEEIEAAATRAIKELQPAWEKTMTAVLVTVLEDFGNTTAEDLGGLPKSFVGPSEGKWQFDPFSQRSQEWIAQHGAELVKTIQSTNIVDVRNVILLGKQQNLLMPEIAKNIRKFYDDRSSFKAMRIARTEVSAAAGFGQREAAMQSGVAKGKKWMSSRDDRVRDRHFAMDGEEKQMDELYTNGLMYPGDPNGSAAEVIQCRCVEEYLSKKPAISEALPQELPEGGLPIGKDWVGTLSSSEREAVSGWSVIDYMDVRSLQRYGKTIYMDQKKAEALLKNLNSALSKSGKYKEVAYRGYSVTDEAYSSLINSKVIEMNAHSSTSAVRGKSIEFMTSRISKGREPILMEIRSKTGVDISAASDWPSEREVLFTMGSRFKVDSVKKITERLMVEGHMRDTTYTLLRVTEV